MNRLSTERRSEVIRCLVEGNSIRATCRMTGTAKNTVVRLLVELGERCADYQDEALRDLPSKRVQADEIWAFVHAKARNVPEEHKGEFGYGDVWTWTAIDSDTRLVFSWLVSDRSSEAGHAFMGDVASRVRDRIQLTTDGHPGYVPAVEVAFGSNVDFAQMIKTYGMPLSEDESPTARRYSPQECTGIDVVVRQGDPDPDHISTSYVERQNLTMRMSMRRFTRLTNAFSRKVENLAAAVSLHFMHYNFGRPHQSLGRNVTPAMAAGVTDHVWTAHEIAALLD